MSFGIQNAGSAGIIMHGSDKIPIGWWLQSYDPDAMDGVGASHWTADPARAMRFETLLAARKCYVTQSVVKPLREDGKPNRPLTSFSVSIVPLD